MKTCADCSLREAKRQVRGSGNPAARIMIVGEAPGEDEEEQGKPFVGRAGRKLRELLGRAGLDPADLWLTNRVQHRPPANKIKNHPDALYLCPRLFLVKEIEAVDPVVIVATGLSAATLWFNATRMGRIAGHAIVERGALDKRRFILATYHPAYLLRQNDPQLEEEVVQVFKVANFLSACYAR